MIAAARRRWVAAAAGALLAAAAAAAGFALKERSAESPERPAGERPELLLLTSLPIVFPEQFSLEASKSPAFDALDERYDVVPISVADQRSLGGHRLLLIAQPNAQPAEVLVELDRWVRAGGHVLLLADPALERHSERPLGDPLRPPVAFADTGLLGHWGLRLDAPERGGRQSLQAAGHEIRTLSPGRLAATGANCAVEPAGLVARCTIGRGKATIIADADFLEAGNSDSASGRGNLALLLDELARLEP